MTTPEEIAEKITTTADERTKAAEDFKQTIAVIHDGGATFQFSPIGGVTVGIILSRIVLNDGRARFVLHQTFGPWGNSRLQELGQEQITDQKWRAHMEVSFQLSLLAIGVAEEVPTSVSWWNGELIRA